MVSVFSISNFLIIKIYQGRKMCSWKKYLLAQILALGQKLGKNFSLVSWKIRDTTISLWNFLTFRVVRTWLIDWIFSGQQSTLVRTNLVKLLKPIKSKAKSLGMILLVPKASVLPSMFNIFRLQAKSATFVKSYCLSIAGHYGKIQKLVVRFSRRDSKLDLAKNQLAQLKFVYFVKRHGVNCQAIKNWASF